MRVNFIFYTCFSVDESESESESECVQSASAIAFVSDVPVHGSLDVFYYMYTFGDQANNNVNRTHMVFICLRYFIRYVLIFLVVFYLILCHINRSSRMDHC